MVFLYNCVPCCGRKTCQRRVDEKDRRKADSKDSDNKPVKNTLKLYIALKYFIHTFLGVRTTISDLICKRAFQNM